MGEATEKSWDEEFFRPPSLTAWENFHKFVWNDETGEFCGRTGLSWAKITVFYLIFYSCLAALVALWMWFFLLTLDPRVPKWTLDESLIGTNPGLGFRPTPWHDEDSTLVRFLSSNKTNYERWTDSISKFLDKYYSPSKGKVKSCSHWDYPNQDKGEVCKVDVRDWGDCNKDQMYHYNNNSPCFFLKLNKIYDWVPDYYDNPSKLPHDMPSELRHHIMNIVNPEQRKTVWVSCQGENPADVENLGPITYHSKGVQGFPGYYFPYLNKEGYLNPLVAVRFEKPVAGILINVECRAWAKNIKYNRADRSGFVHFELLVEH